MSAFVGCYYHPTILRQPFHPFLHPAVTMCASIITSALSTSQKPKHICYLYLLLIKHEQRVFDVLERTLELIIL